MGRLKQYRRPARAADALGRGGVTRHLVGEVGPVGPSVVDKLGRLPRTGTVVVEAGSDNRSGYDGGRDVGGPAGGYSARGE